MRQRSAPPIEIRDPIHGSICVDASEAAVVDHRFVQRLRGIRQLGFSHLPFPGATHTRYAHSLGVMHMVGAVFDACFRDDCFPSGSQRAAYRHCVRLAALCHDLGHAPFSHAAEFAMPPLSELGIDAYDPACAGARPDRQATHEDYTVAILTRSSLAETISANFPFGPTHVASLVCPEVTVRDDFFRMGDFDLRPILSQMVSSDLDADRLDYLQRDSYYTGARYGAIDVDWLKRNLTRHVDEQGRVCLALDHRAVYAFDDYMIARFHMFVMVYFHQRSIAYEAMLRRTMRSPDCTYRLPADLDAYLQTDDAHMTAYLRASDDPWARRIVERRPYHLVREVCHVPGELSLDAEAAALTQAGIDPLRASATSGVYGHQKAVSHPLYVVETDPCGGHATVSSIEQATSVFQRYHERQLIERIYVAPDCVDRAREILVTEPVRSPGPLELLQ